MAICIAVKYHGPTNYRGSRFTATVAWGQEKNAPPCPATMS